MATTTTETILFDGTRRSVHHITGLNTDASAESDVQKVDISTLTGPDGSAPTSVTVEGIEWNIQGFSAVELLWDHTSNDTIVFLSGAGEFNWVPVGGKQDPGSTGGTGDILLTSRDAAANDTYDITLYLRHEV